jgi:hypothetical protein
VPAEVDAFVDAEKKTAEPRIIVPAGAGRSAPGERSDSKSEGGEEASPAASPNARESADETERDEP